MIKAFDQGYPVVSITSDVLRTLSNGQKISIAKNLDIDGDNYRIDDDRGEGCNTRWFPTMKALIAFTEKSLSNDFENNGVYL